MNRPHPPFAPLKPRLPSTGSSSHGPVTPALRHGQGCSRATTLFGLLASKRLAHQMARRVYARRTALRPTAPPKRRREEPTYRCEPARKFSSDAARQVLKTTVDEHLNAFVYSSEAASAMSKTVADAVKDGVKRLGFERYKIVCAVVVGENREQSLKSCSRCVWDSEHDTSATYNWQSPSAFCSVTVYGVYHE